MTSKDINAKGGAESRGRKTLTGRREDAHLAARGNEAQCLRAPRAKSRGKGNETGGSGRLMGKQKSPLTAENSGG